VKKLECRLIGGFHSQSIDNAGYHRSNGMHQHLGIEV
jgi:hypothetical protein